MRILLFLILVIIVSVTSTNYERKYAYDKMIRALKKYKATGIRPSYLEPAVQVLNDPKYAYNRKRQFDTEETCQTCELVSDLMIQQSHDGMSDNNFALEVYFFCNLYGGHTERVCRGLVELNTPIFLYIIDNTANITGKLVCAKAFQYQGCTSDDLDDWTIYIPPRKGYRKPKSTGANSFKVLHITDIHYDPRYVEGKSNVCGEPVCCQYDQPEGNSSETKCGYWSDYINADIPWRTVINALEQTTTHDYDFIYFTGDIIPHRVWNTSQIDNTQIIAQIFDAFVLHYKVPVYPVLGNHEAHPANEFSEIDDPKFTTKWLFDVLFQKMSKWLPIEEVKETVMKGGYYTVSPKKGLRVVVLNNNHCNSDNWWLIYKSRDPYDQLKWLVDVLLKAEENNERVHLLLHIPSGRNECYRIWAREYRRIIDRFADTIAAQFNGHTHRDEFNIYYDKSNSSNAISMAWNGASIVTYDKANPSYKLLSFDADTFDLLDFEEWTYNLTLANLRVTPSPVWYKLYSFKDAYGVNSLEAEEINKLVLKMTKEHDLIDQYYRFKFRNGDVALKEGCDDDCKKDLLCDMVKTEFGDNEVCERVKKLYDLQSEIKVTVLK